MKIRAQWRVKTGHRWEALAAPCLKTVQPAYYVTRCRCRGCYISCWFTLSKCLRISHTPYRLSFFFFLCWWFFFFYTNKTPYPLTLFRIEIIILKCIVQNCFEWTGNNNNTLLSLMQYNVSKRKLFNNIFEFKIKLWMSFLCCWQIYYRCSCKTFDLLLIW